MCDTDTPRKQDIVVGIYVCEQLCMRTDPESFLGGLTTDYSGMPNANTIVMPAALQQCCLPAGIFRPACYETMAVDV